MTRHVCICGSGYSGSTLLNLLLGSHPCILSLGETRFLARSIIENRECTCRQPVKSCPFWRDIRREIARTRGIDIFEQPDNFPVSILKDKRTLRGLLMHYQRIALAMQGFTPLSQLELNPKGYRSTQTIVDNVLHLHDVARAISGRQIVVDSSKSPILMKWLWMSRPSQVKILYLVRDGRAVTASHVRRTGGPAKPEVHSWIKVQVLARMMVWTMPRAAWMLVRHENLCNDPTYELKRICQFVGLEFSEDMLDFRKPGHHDLEGNRMRFDTSKEIVYRETWRQELSQADLKIFERRAGLLNRLLGYSD